MNVVKNAMKWTFLMINILVGNWAVSVSREQAVLVSQHEESQHSETDMQPYMMSSDVDLCHEKSLFR